MHATISWNDHILWTGDVEDGAGTHVALDGPVRGISRGDYEDRRLDGTCVVVCANGDVAMGRFHANSPVLDHCTLLDADGVVNVNGTHVATLQHHVPYEFPDLAGCDTLRTKEGVYMGALCDGAPHGVGLLLYSTGAVYVGEWLNGMHHGMGCLVVKDGSVFMGQFDRNCPGGRGTYMSSMGQVICGYMDRSFTRSHDEQRVTTPRYHITPLIVFRPERLVIAHWRHEAQRRFAARTARKLLEDDMRTPPKKVSRRARRKAARKKHDIDEVTDNFETIRIADVTKAKEKTDAQTEVDGECIVCFEAAPSHVVVPCGHLCLCATCAVRVSPHECPVCRAHSDCIIRVFTT